MKIYLDVCCLNRPFDDQSYDRIRLESRAVSLILEGVEAKRFLWYGSEIVFDEIENTPDHIKKNDMLSLCKDISEVILLTEGIEVRGRQLCEKGFSAYDALHLASCEAAGVDIFLTVDDKLIKRTVRLGNEIGVKVGNPLLWIKEMVD